MLEKNLCVSLLRWFLIYLALFSGASCVAKKEHSKVKYGEPFLSNLDNPGCLCSGPQDSSRCIERMLSYTADPEQLLVSQKVIAARKIDKRYAATQYTSNQVPAAAKLDKAEKLALVAYTDDLFSAMNAALRERGIFWKEWKDIIYPAASGLNKLRPFWGLQAQVFRMESIALEDVDKVINTYQVGKLVVEPSFLSTSATLRPWSYNIGEMPIKYVIDSKSGVLINRLSIYPHESEVLFSPGAIFEVKSINQIKKQDGELDFTTPEEYIVIELTEKEIL